MKPEGQEHKKDPGARFSPLWAGGLASLLVVLIVAILGAYTPSARPETLFGRFLAQRPSEMGDTIAGIMATLAFIWLVTAALLQSASLRTQKKELAATRAELELAREVQEQQLEAMRAQADVFKDEQRERRQERSRRTVIRLIQSLAATHLRENRFNGVWTISPTGHEYESAFFARIPTLPTRSDIVGGESELASAMEEFCVQSEKLAQKIVAGRLPETVLERPSQTIAHTQVLGILSEIWSRVDELSEADKIWVQTMSIEHAKYAWEDLLATDEIWDNRP